MDKFRNKYRIQSARLQNWDYGWNGSYFLTICTRNRQYYFGEVIQGEMKLSEIGQLAEKFLLEIPDRYEYAMLDEFAIMPNHIHTIIIIIKTGNDKNDDRVVMGNDHICRDAINRVSTNPPNATTNPKNATTNPKNTTTNPKNTTTNPKNTTTNPKIATTDPPNATTDPPTEQAIDSIINPLQKNVGGITGNKNPMLHDNISRIMNWYTGRVTFESHKINNLFGWQARFHDHIIRDFEEYQRIKDYIRNNPKNWNSDTFNKPV